MNQPFTVFFCGTCSNSFDFANKNYFQGELVSTLARNVTSMEFVDWIICDGPGSGNLQADELWVKPGHSSALSGAGWEQNVAHAMSILKGEEYSWSREQLSNENVKQLVKAGVTIEKPHFWQPNPARKVTPQELQLQKVKIFRKGHSVSHVNLIGWSRGAVTCHMMAFAMKLDQKLSNLPVNIFAIDPVPGSYNNQMHRTTILDNVKEYVGIFARDETSSGFAPILPSFAEGVKRIIYVFPGRHATVVGNAGNYVIQGSMDFTAPGKVVRHLAETYLTKWETKLNHMLNLSDFELLKLYDEMLGQMPGYKQLRKQVYTAKQWGYGRDVKVGSGEGFVKFDTVDQFKPDPVFVNEHHRSLHLRHYPWNPLSNNTWQKSFPNLYRTMMHAL